MAWYDMRQVSNYTHDILGEEACVALLQVYGMAPGQARKVLQEVQGGLVPKGLRNLMRFAFGIRSRL